MMRYLFIIICLLFVGCSDYYGGEAYNAAISRTKLLELHNKERKSSLKLDIALNKYAQQHARWMASHKLDHSDMSDLSKTDKWYCWGENIAKGQTSEEEVVRDWMNSRGHRQNIKKTSYTHVGFGAAKSKDGTLFWCTVFGGITKGNS